MKKLTIDSILKILILATLIYLAFTLGQISTKLDNRRYENDGSTIFDTRTGKKYRYQDGNLVERKY
jgi:hypothetical protein